MAMTKQQSNWGETLLGFVIILVTIFGVASLGYWVYDKFFEPAPLTVSSSAYFVDKSGNPVCTPDSPTYSTSQLKIKGTVHQGEQPLKSGLALITVNAADNPFQQSVSVPVS